MKTILWLLSVVVLLAAINALAVWFGSDVAGEAEDDEHSGGHDSAGRLPGTSEPTAAPSHAHH